MAAFALVVFVSFAYLVSNGALDWGPARRSGRSAVDVTRTTSSTVRRVPRPSELVDAAGAQTRPLDRSEPGPTESGPTESGPTESGPTESAEPVPAGHGTES